MHEIETLSPTQLVRYVSFVANEQKQEMIVNGEWKQLQDERNENGDPEIITNESQEKCIMAAYGSIVQRMLQKEWPGKFTYYPEWRYVVLDCCYESAEKLNTTWDKVLFSVLQEMVKHRIGYQEPNEPF